MADIVFPGAATDSVLNSDAMPSNYDMQIYKGDYVDLYITVSDSSQAAINLTGFTARASLKTNYTDMSPVAFDCTVLPTQGQVRIYLPSSKSKDLIPGAYIWDFEIVNPQGDSRTYLTGDVTVYNEVTTG